MALPLAELLFGDFRDDDADGSPEHSSRRRSLGGAAQRTSATDEMLVARLRAGDESAAEAIFRAEFDSLVRYVRRFSGSFDAAQDLAQEALIEFIEQQRVAGDAELPRSSTALLRTIARRRAINSWKREQRIAQIHDSIRTRESDFESEGVGAGQAAELPDVALQRAEVIAAVRRAFDALPPRARLIASMRWSDQHGRQEIAAELGVSVRTVDAQLYLVAERIRKVLAPFR